MESTEQSYTPWGREEVRIFGEVLRDARVRSGLTQEALAFRMDTERSHISDLERATKGPSLTTLLRLAGALNMTAAELISQVEQKLREERQRKTNVAGPRKSVQGHAHILPETPTVALTLMALGVVYGDIGTSPLYAAKETFSPAHGIPLTPENILGGVSAIFWTLMVVVSLKDRKSVV